MNMNILVTGANGQLGNELRLASLNSSHSFVFADICEETAESCAMLSFLASRPVNTATVMLDITNPEAIGTAVREMNIDAVVNCAAFTNVDAAESNEALAAKLNADSPGYLAAAMKERGGLLVHISTDYVFGREPYNTPCREDREGTPTGVYGLSKLKGEQLIAQSGCKSVIVRTAWLYSEFGKNFCRTMMSLTSSRPSVKVVFDQAGTPTYAGDLARALLKILDDYAAEGDCFTRFGIYNYSNEGVCSWFDFARMTARFAGNAACEVLPCHSSEFPSPVVRPSYSVLDKTKVKETFGVAVPYWVDSLELCVKNLLSVYE